MITSYFPVIPQPAQTGGPSPQPVSSLLFDLQMDQQHLSSIITLTLNIYNCGMTAESNLMVCFINNQQHISAYLQIVANDENKKYWLSCSSLHVLGRPNVVNLENHLDQLCGKLDLRLLGVQGLNDRHLFHVSTSLKRKLKHFFRCDSISRTHYVSH